MMKNITCIVDFDDTLTHGGVTFTKDRPFEVVDTSKVEVYPFFEGNPSFVVEDAEDETTETENQHDDDAAVGADSGSESFGFDYQAATRPELVEYLEGREVKFGKRLSLDKLRKLAEQNV